MRKIYLGYFVIIIIFILSYNLAQGRYNLKSPEVSDVSSDGYLFTELSGDLLTVDIRDVTLKEVLNQLSAQNGITFLLPPLLGEEKIMVRFSNYKIDKGLNKILAPYDRIFIYTEENRNPHQPLLNRLKEVRIYPRYEEKKRGRVEMTSIKQPKASKSSSESKDKSAEGYRKKESAKEGGVKSVGTSFKSLKNESRWMNIEGVRKLAKEGGAKAIGSLASVLKYNEKPEVRKEAEKALDEIGENLRRESENDDPDLDESTPSEGGGTNLTLAKGSGNGINLELSNDVPVRGVQFTLNGAKPTEVRTTSRTEGFFARVNEKNGTVVLVSLSGKKIAPGTGPIAEIVCNNKGSANLSDIKIGE